MFLFFDIHQNQQQLEYTPMIICDECQSYGKYNVFVTYMVFRLFFIPLFKWNKQYYVQTTCCQTIYALNPEAGRQIEKGMNYTIHSSDLIKQSHTTVHICSNCGYKTKEDFDYCPKCGHKL